MQVFAASEMETFSADVSPLPGTLVPHWLEGPHTAARLNVGLVTMSPGGATPPHSHDGGQVLVVTAGTGFVEVVGGERRIVSVGDVIVAAPGETHVHGALADGAFAHLTVTTLGYQFPGAPTPTGPTTPGSITPGS